MPFKLLIQLSWRNLWRHRRRNGILLSAIAVAVAGVVLLNSLLRGMQSDMENAIVDNLTGHVKVLRPGYREDPSVKRAFMADDRWLQDLPPAAIAGWASRVRVPAVAMSERETRGIQLVGVAPERETISFLGSVSIQGEGLTGSEDRRIVIGAALAEQLETEVGRRLVLVTQGADGRNREAGYRIAGIYRASMGGLEKVFVFTGAQALGDKLDTAAVTEVSVRLQEDAFEDRVVAALKDVFAGLDVLTWRQLEPQAAAIVGFADSAIFIYFLVIMGALVFGLVNTLVTAVMERVRELGMLRALGMRPRSVIAQVMLESSLIMSVGVVTGMLIAFAVFASVSDGIDLTAFSDSLATFGLRPVFVPVIEMGDVVLVAAMSLILGLIASFYPARRAVKLTPLEALRR